MRKAFTDITIEISEKEIEILAELKREFKELVRVELNCYDSLVDKFGEEEASKIMPRGFRYTAYLKVLENFENLEQFGETELPF